MIIGRTNMVNWSGCRPLYLNPILLRVAKSVPGGMNVSTWVLMILASMEADLDVERDLSLIADDFVLMLVGYRCGMVADGLGCEC